MYYLKYCSYRCFKYIKPRYLYGYVVYTRITLNTKSIDVLSKLKQDTVHKMTGSYEGP